MTASEALEGLFPPAIDGKTRILGVFGFPIEHSLSPAMHNAAIAALGLNHLYIPFSVQPDQIGPAIRSLIALGIIGVNLTIPLKELVLPHLDRIAPQALALGAVNTVHNDGGCLVGYNTDEDGFAGPLAAKGFNPRGKRAVVLGAGGAARAVVFRLLRDGAAVTLLNRTAARAAALADSVRGASGDLSLVDAGDRGATANAVAEAELLVNATPVGMWPHVDDALPVDSSALHPDLLVYDLIYNPLETRLLAAAREAGARTLNGVGMLVHQGAAAFEIWTGSTPPLEVMERAVLGALKARATA